MRELRSCLTAAVLDHPGVDHLVAGHLRLSGSNAAEGGAARAIQPGAAADSPGRAEGLEGASLAEVLSLIDGIDPDRLGQRELGGSLPQILKACGELVGRLLRRGAEMQRRPSPRSPDGALLPQPTLQWLCDDSSLDATAAYDTILRLRKAAGEDSLLWRNDPVLQELVERARAKRRRTEAPRRGPERERG